MRFETFWRALIAVYLVAALLYAIAHTALEIAR